MDLLPRLVKATSNFQQMLHDLRKTKIAESVEKGYSEVLEVLKDAAKSQKQLLNHCQELKAQISVSEKRIQETEDERYEAEKTLDMLKKEMEQACKCFENFQEREIKFKQQILELEAKIVQLENKEDTSMPEKEKAFQIEVERERKLLNARISELEDDLKIKKSTEEEIKSKLLETMEAMHKLEGNLETLRLKLKQELGRNQKVTKDRLLVEKELKAKEDRISELDEIVTVLKRNITATGKKINNYESIVSLHQSKINYLQELYIEAQEQAKFQLQNFKSVSNEKDKLALLLDKKDDDMKNLNIKLVNIINEKESLLQKFLTAQNQKQHIESKFESLRKQLLNYEREMLKLKKFQAQHESEVSALIREKELLAKNVLKMETLVEKYSNESVVWEKERITLCRNLKTSKQHVEKLNRIISNLEAMKIQLLDDIKELTKKIEVLNNIICDHEDKATQMQVKIAELTSKFNEQTEIVSAAVFDRKMFCQKYKDLEENRDQMKQKVSILDNCVSELKESLYSKNEEVITWKNKWESLYFQNKNLISKAAKEMSDHKDLEIQFKHEEHQNGLHLQFIAAKEKEIETLQRKLIYKTEECLTLHSQMQSQRAKISDLEEKIQLSEKVIQREKEAYLNLENSTKLLHLEILRLTGEKNSLTCKINDLEKLKESFMYAKQELNKERFKNSALERTIQRPTNIHRWRLLKGTDPEKCEILEKYQTLQKHLLEKSKEVQCKDNKICSMSKLINQMKNLTAQQKEFQQKYSTGIKQKRLLREKTEKLKVLSFEINMYETYMSSYQAEISNLKDVVTKLKTNEYFKKKKITPLMTHQQTS